MKIDRSGDGIGVWRGSNFHYIQGGEGVWKGSDPRSASAECRMVRVGFLRLSFPFKSPVQNIPQNGPKYTQEYLHLGRGMFYDASKYLLNLDWASATIY